MVNINRMEYEKFSFCDDFCAHVKGFESMYSNVVLFLTTGIFKCM
jgi:hypothetical protein